MTDTDQTSIVIFGASGDLTRRKLIPSLLNLHLKRRLRGNFQIVGHAHSTFSEEQFRAHLHEGVKEHAAFTFSDSEWQTFASKIRYHQGGYEDPADFRSLNDFLCKQEAAGCNRLYYMATPPDLFPGIVKQLAATGQLTEEDGWRHVVIEKPFGTNLASAQALNQQLHQVVREHQIYRIDHYLGKETVQNILVTRFANTIFEPLWNRNYVDHVQITVAEDVGVEHRAGYYDSVGVLRDMFQNHLLQLMALVAMEPPASFDATSLRNEKVKVLTSVQPLDGAGAARNTLRAQYKGYRKEEGVRADSTTATFAVVKFRVDNWRWQGVPFYLRSGKCLEDKVSHIAIEFKRPPHNLFRRSNKGMNPNVLVLFLQPHEGLHWRFETKVPDSATEMRAVDMEFHYADSFEGEEIPEAYERLLLDAMAGDASLFTRADEVEAAWGLIDPILQAWQSDDPLLLTYKPGTWGPSEAEAILARDGRSWMNGLSPGHDALES